MSCYSGDPKGLRFYPGLWSDSDDCDPSTSPAHAAIDCRHPGETLSWTRSVSYLGYGFRGFDSINERHAFSTRHSLSFTNDLRWGLYYDGNYHQPINFQCHPCGGGMFAVFFLSHADIRIYLTLAAGVAYKRGMQQARIKPVDCLPFFPRNNLLLCHEVHNIYCLYSPTLLCILCFRSSTGYNFHECQCQFHHVSD